MASPTSAFHPILNGTSIATDCAPYLYRSKSLALIRSIFARLVADGRRPFAVVPVFSRKPEILSGGVDMTILIVLAIYAMFLLVSVFSTYIITLVLVKGHLFTFARCWFRVRTLWLIKGPPGDRRHLIDCRLCTGAWVSAAVTLVAIGALWCACWWANLEFALGFLGTAALMAGFFVVYGGSHFMAMQERW